MLSFDHYSRPLPNRPSEHYSPTNPIDFVLNVMKTLKYLATWSRANDDQDWADARRDVVAEIPNVLSLGISRSHRTSYKSTTS